MKHPRAELIAKWLEDTEQKIWYWDEHKEMWRLTTSLVLLNEMNEQTFAVGHKVPEPLEKMCEMGGIKFPMPMQNEPEKGFAYYAVNMNGPMRIYWDGDQYDQARLRNGRCQKTREGAELQIKAILSEIQNSINDVLP